MARTPTLSERERLWRGYATDPEWPVIMARAKRREIWIISMAVGSTRAEWVLRYVDYQAPVAQPDLEEGW